VTTAGIIEGFARRERATAIAALLVVIVLSAFLMLRSGDALMMMPGGLTFAWVAVLFLMWWTMMMAMMLPSAAPAILTFGGISRRLDGDGATTRTFTFCAGYLLVWTAFSVAAVLVQLAAEPILRLNGMFATTSRVAGGVLLIVAGLYQLTPLKGACLRKCQMPLIVFARNWRPGLGGALRMGVGHGLYCLGCCFVLMLILFYGGVMEPLWIAGLAAYVLIEKLLPRHWQVSRLTGILLCAWGGVILWHVLG
jgi:predicted metal-binding membrane protein